MRVHHLLEQTIQHRSWNTTVELVEELDRHFQDLRHLPALERRTEEDGSVRHKAQLPFQGPCSLPCYDGNLRIEVHTSLGGVAPERHAGLRRHPLARTGNGMRT